MGKVNANTQQTRNNITNLDKANDNGSTCDGPKVMLDTIDHSNHTALSQNMSNHCLLKYTCFTIAWSEDSLLSVFAHYGVLVHEDNVVTVEGRIMYKPKASALSARDNNTCQSALTNPVMNNNCYSLT